MIDEVGEKDYVDADAGAARKHNILALSYAEVQERLAEPATRTSSSFRWAAPRSTEPTSRWAPTAT